MHDCCSLGGIIRERLEERGVEFDEFLVVDDFENPISDKAFPDPSGYDLIVATGAPWSFCDEKTIGTWIHREVEFLKRVDTAGVPFFGICFGAQALSASFGGTVEKAPVTEIGWHHVMTAVPDVVAEGPWMQWHVDGFTAPPGAEVLAKSPAGVQAIRIHNHFAVQFHPEMTPELLDLWINAGGDRELAEAGVSSEALVAETKVKSELARPNSRHLADYFLDTCVLKNS